MNSRRDMDMRKTHAPVQRRAAQRIVRCNPLLDDAFGLAPLIGPDVLGGQPRGLFDAFRAGGRLPSVLDPLKNGALRRWGECVEVARGLLVRR